MFLILSVSLFVCLVAYSKSYELILMKCFGEVKWPENQSIRFWWRSESRFDQGFLDPNQDSGPGFFKRIFLLFSGSLF